MCMKATKKWPRGEIFNLTPVTCGDAESILTALLIGYSNCRVNFDNVLIALSYDNGTVFPLYVQK